MENAKKKYDAPEAEVILFDNEDVITTSGEKGGVVGHATRMPTIY